MTDLKVRMESETLRRITGERVFSWPRSTSSSKAVWGLTLLICGFVLFFAYYVILQHAAFETFGYDLGNFSQTVWNTSRGRFMSMTTVPGSTFRWAFHFEPVLVLFVPIYAVFPTPVTLTLLQVLVVAIGAIPIFWIARDFLHSEWAGIVYAGVFLMLPALQAAVTFDFHGVTLAMTFLAFALWALLNERYMLFGVFSLLVMSCKEDMPLLVLMMGLYILFIQRNWKVGIITILASLAWFAIANFLIIPTHSPIGDNIHIARYGDLGDSMGEVIVSIFTNPLRVLAFAFEPPKPLYWALLTMPVAFTSLLNPLLLFLALPSLAINTLSNNSATYSPNTFHYTAPIVPFIVVSSISGVAFLSRRLGRGDEKRRSAWRVRLLIIVIGASLGYHIMVGFTPLRLGFEWPTPDGHDKLAQRMLNEIPPQAPVSAQNSLVPHLANRSQVYIFPKVENAEYIAIDTKGSYFPFDEYEDLCGEVRLLVDGTSYGSIFFADGLLLLQRDVPDNVEVSPAAICSEAAGSGS